MGFIQAPSFASRLDAGARLSESVKLKLCIRGGAGSHAKYLETSSSPIQPFDLSSNLSESNQDARAGKRCESPSSPVLLFDVRSDEGGGDGHRQMGDQRRKRRQSEDASLEHQSFPERNEPSNREHRPPQPFGEATVQDSQHHGHGSEQVQRPRGDPYRLKRIRGRRTARHDEEAARLPYVDSLIIHISRHGLGRHRVWTSVEGLEDTFYAREEDNDMSDSEVEEHVVAAVKNIWRNREGCRRDMRRKAERGGAGGRGRRLDKYDSLTPSPGCGCSIL